MREIKFRAYAPEQERMLSWKELIGYHDLDSLFGYIDDTDNIWHKIPMQYTGVKDIKGVEIYEGDILQSEHYFKYKVVFKGDGWRCDSLKNSRFKNRFIGRDLKVIGNIYENPELLEVEQQDGKK